MYTDNGIGSDGVSRRGDDADFVVFESDVVDDAVEGSEGFPHGIVEGVEGSFSDGDTMDGLFSDLQEHGGFGFDDGLSTSVDSVVVDDAKADEFEEAVDFPEEVTDVDIEAGVGVVERVSLGFVLFDGVEEFIDGLIVDVLCEFHFFESYTHGGSSCLV